MTIHRKIGTALALAVIAMAGNTTKAEEYSSQTQNAIYHCTGEQALALDDGISPADVIAKSSVNACGDVIKKFIDSNNPPDQETADAAWSVIYDDQVNVTVTYILQNRLESKVIRTNDAGDNVTALTNILSFDKGDLVDLLGFGPFNDHAVIKTEPKQTTVVEYNAATPGNPVYKVTTYVAFASKEGCELGMEALMRNNYLQQVFPPDTKGKKVKFFSSPNKSFMGGTGCAVIGGKNVRFADIADMSRASAEEFSNENKEQGAKAERW